MTEHNMRHLDHMEDVVRNDVRILREKESTYQGSWKRSGGRSAWFMIKRMMDRLFVMLARPDDSIPWLMEQGSEQKNFDALTKALQAERRSEDIFLAIEADMSGADGTVLAVIQDLRRYLILVEAEMRSRAARPYPLDDIVHETIVKKDGGGPKIEPKRVVGDAGASYSNGGAPCHATDPTGPNTRLPVEQNAQEYRELIPMHQRLYTWDDGVKKYLMRKEYHAEWGRFA